MRLRISRAALIAAAVAVAISAAALLLAIFHVRHPSDLTMPVIAIIAPAWLGIVIASFVAGSDIVALTFGFACSFAAWYLLAKAVATVIHQAKRDRLVFWGQLVGFAIIYALGVLTTMVPPPG